MLHFTFVLINLQVFKVKRSSKFMRILGFYLFSSDIRISYILAETKHVYIFAHSSIVERKGFLM